MITIKAIIDSLEKLGFSNYEAKAYFALIRKHPASGYEISKISKIPPGKIYSTLNSLKIKGAIVEEGTEQGKYYPIPPGMLLTKVKEDYSNIIDRLEVRLTEAEPIADIDLTVNLSGYDSFVEKMIAVIDKAKTSLLLSIWPEEAVLLTEPLSAAKKRGVTIVTAIFGEALLANTHSINIKSCGDSSHARLGTRLMAIVGDDKEVVIGEVGENEEAEGVWTTTPAIVLVTKEYIKHDIWGNVMVHTLGLETFKKLCDENELISYIIKNR